MLSAAMALSIAFTSCKTSTTENEETTRSVKDPTDAKIFTLENGLKVYLSVNKDKPRVQTFIAVKTGSKNDPSDVTGLAHYLEHMVFKGTSNLGTQDWENEKVLLDSISTLYEMHRAEPDAAKKNEIYAQIDKVSGAAAKFAVANEYDKMISGLGAKGTNAFTSVEQTMYINDIPATEIEKWMKVESERFSELVLRLFHTELEAVYEEFNRGQDNDYRKAYKAMNELMFEKHPYGTQSTIGLGEHLKNPSMVKIHEYFNKYYVANNMAICLSGDIDVDKTLAMIKKYFGGLKKGEVNAPVMPKEDLITSPRVTQVFGPMAESVRVSYRVGGYKTEDALMVQLFDIIMSNGQAGIIDLDLNQKQKVLSAGSGPNVMYDYSVYSLSGNPKQGQSLEEVKDLLLGTVEKVKKGDFTTELMESSIKYLKVSRLQEYEENWSRAYAMANSFIMEDNWLDYISDLSKMEKISKQELVDWANANMKNNYCVVYKRSGEDTATFKVDKPQITPVEVNRDVQSEFYKDFEKMESLRLTPDFIDYKTAINTTELIPGVDLYYIPNTSNELFSLYIDMDEDLKYNEKVGIAMKYLQYLGTDSLTAEGVKTEFFNLGVQFSANSSSRGVYYSLSGLNESLKPGLALFENLVANAQPNDEALKNLIADQLKKREDNKKNKGIIMRSGLGNYAKYGAKNPFNSVLSTEELEAITSQELLDILKSLSSYKHNILYYGESSQEDVVAEVRKMHQLPETAKTVTDVPEYPELDINENKVYFVDYDMVQTELRMISKDEKFNAEKVPYISMFNTFFGAGLSSIVFQEIRESKALAYSANCYMSNPKKANESHYVSAYVGTQSNKMQQAVSAITELMNNMPEATIQFNESKVATLKKIESDRVIKTSIYWNYKAAKNLELDYDIRKTTYDKVKDMTLADMKIFFDNNIKGRNYTYTIIGKRADVDMEALKQLGTIKELTLEEVFGY
jgi:zinc protease